MKVRTRLLITSIFLFTAGSYWLVDWILQDFRFHYYMTLEESMVDSSTLLSSLVAQQVHDETITLDAIFCKGLLEAPTRDLSAQIYDFTKTNMNLRVLITDQQSTVLFDSQHGEAEGEDYSGWRDIRLTMAGQYGARATTILGDNPESLTFFVASPVIVNGKILGAVSVGKPISSILPFMQKAKYRLIMTGISAVSAVLLLQLLISFWVTRPICTLITYARAVRDGKNVTKPRLNHSDMGDLAAAFEEMRDALEGREYVERYVQALTHEMKSPLSAIQGASELLSEPMSKEQRDRFLSNIRSEARRTQELIDRLLTLAGLEKRKKTENVEPIDAATLTKDVIDSMRPIAQKKTIHISQTLKNPANLTGEYFLLRQTLVNLLQNALDFSPEGGTIQVRIEKKDGFVVIRIEDEGPGVPDYAASRIFERFYSLPRPGHGKKSSGLGLNFAREAAALHGGALSLSNRTPHGAEACLRLPSAPD